MNPSNPELERERGERAGAWRGGMTMTAEEFHKQWRPAGQLTDYITAAAACVFAEAYARIVSSKAAEAPGGQDLETQQKDFALKMLNDDLEHSVSCMNRSCRRCNEIQRRFGPSQEAEGFSCQAAPAAPSERADEAKTLRETGEEFLLATERLLDWMNGNDLSADHDDRCPEDYQRLCAALTNFQAAIRGSSQEGK